METTTKEAPNTTFHDENVIIIMAPAVTITRQLEPPVVTTQPPVVCLSQACVYDKDVGMARVFAYWYNHTWWHNTLSVRSPIHEDCGFVR